MIEPYDEQIESEIPLLKCVCAWCGALIHEAMPGWENDGVSHGICSQCSEMLRQEHRKQIEVSA